MLINCRLLSKALLSSEMTRSFTGCLLSGTYLHLKRCSKYIHENTIYEEITTFYIRYSNDSSSTEVVVVDVVGIVIAVY